MTRQPVPATLHPTLTRRAKLLEGQGEQPQLFSDFNGLPSENAAYEWYQHTANWSNRLIHGESARVMASLLAREPMAGKVQMIYFDPPYGMGYNSNFQVSVNQRDKTPENAEGRPLDTRTIRAFRDTYERGVHSYLDGILEKLKLFRELLKDDGSLFFQIGDENVMRVGLLCDEVFGAENRVALITYLPTSGSRARTLPEASSYLLWYAKDKNIVKYHQLYETQHTQDILQNSASKIEMADGTRRKLTSDERTGAVPLPDGSRLYRSYSLYSMVHSDKGHSEPYLWATELGGDGGLHSIGAGRRWSVSTPAAWRHANGPSDLDDWEIDCAMNRLAKANRLEATSLTGSLNQIRYWDEVPGTKINNVWKNQMTAVSKQYVVQTSEKVVARCMLMATDPGDLVLDPTCGSGTTALTAEYWGRRWITCDTSPITIAIARQRIATTVLPYYLLLDSPSGHKEECIQSGAPWQQHHLPSYGYDPAKGFIYERFNRVSAAQLTLDDDEDPEITYCVDRPVENKKILRVSSPFTVESEQPWATVLPLEGTDDELVVAHDDFLGAVQAALLGQTINGGRDNADITIRALEPWAGKSNLLAWKAVYTLDGGAAEHTAAVMVAAEDVTVPGEMIREAAREITDSAERADMLLVVAYAYAPDAPSEVGRFAIARAQMNRDLMIRELSDEKGHEAFVILGEPDIKIIDCPHDQIAVEVLGYDTFDPATGNASAGGPDDVACWMVDTDHDGESFFARRIHFPGADEDRQIKNLLKKLGKKADAVEREALTAMRSAPFDRPERGRIAVKVVTATGMEMTATSSTEEFIQ